jgi:hypothetical protein
MAGELVPLVMFPRFSTLCGSGTYATLGMDVTEFQNAILNCWRGALYAGTTFSMAFEESTDGVNWTNCTGAAPLDPTSTETQVTAQLKKRWFRVTVTLGGSPTPAIYAATCWAIGYLEQRER